MWRVTVNMYRFMFRDAYWLTADRAAAVTQVMLLVLLGLVVSIPWSIPTMQVGRDFGAFWTAAEFALNGHAEEAYGDAGRDAVAALFGPGHYPPFFYPPNALLIWLPFAFVPFAVAVALWVSVTGVAYVGAIRAILGNRSIIPAISFPVVLFCALYGQNSLLSAALLGAAAVTLDRFPALAGILIGCLAYKPQLALLAPLALATAGRWRAFLAAAGTVVALVGGSVVAFDTKTWIAFIGALPAAQEWNANGLPGFDKFASPYAAMRLLGSSEREAWAIQAATIVAATAALVWTTAFRRPGGAAEVATLVVATGFCVPFLGDYEFLIFVVPSAWLASEAVRKGWLPYERMTLAVLYLSPLIIKPASVHGVPLAPLAVAALAALTLRRVFRNTLPLGGATV
jgi:Glycosyltransferase family 87